MYPTDPALAHFMRGFFVLLPIFIVVGIAIVLVPTWRICQKAGFSPWLSLLMLVPLGNLILLYFLAFADWRVVPMDQLGWPPPIHHHTRRNIRRHTHPRIRRQAHHRSDDKLSVNPLTEADTTMPQRACR